MGENYLRYIIAVTSIGGGRNKNTLRKILMTIRKSLTNS